MDSSNSSMQHEEPGQHSELQFEKEADDYSSEEISQMLNNLLRKVITF